MPKKEIENIDIWAEIESLPEEQRERVFKLLNLPLGEVITRFDKSQTYPKTDDESGEILNNDYHDAPYVLREILGVASAKELNETLAQIREAIEDLDAKLRNHRHDTTKQYSAKPEF